MIIEPESLTINGREIILRCAREDEAMMLIDYLKTVTGETRFLMCEADEIQYTEEGERAFIKHYNDAKDSLLLLAFVDGEYAGNCSFARKGGTRRTAHRAGIGIALYQKFTGMGIGRVMLNKLLEEIKSAGFEQAVLTVIEGNTRAYKLYQSLGFVECGRMPKASKYDDGTYADDIFMVLDFSALDA